jgi:thiol-disulfide isomerase/thioredoxin
VDRLSSVTRLLSVFILGAGVACQPGPSNGPARQRAEIVTESRPALSAAQWCDAYFAPDQAPPLSLPPVAPIALGPTPDAKPSTWVWLNLWATWCKPCVRELPLVVAFGDHLRSEGLRVENRFLSLDPAGPELLEFVRQHAALGGASSMRLSSPDDLDAWVQRFGLKSGTSIPINVIVAPGGGVRCVRAGSITDGDYARVRGVLKQME